MDVLVQHDVFHCLLESVNVFVNIELVMGPLSTITNVYDDFGSRYSTLLLGLVLKNV